MMARVVRVQRLGVVPYLRAWDHQRTVADRVRTNVKAGRDPGHTLMLLQHTPVYTTGLRDFEYSGEEEARLRSLGAEFHRTNRGGLITFHGPGQLTVYPVLHLASFSPGIKWYVCALEKAVIRTCRALGVAAQTSPHTGVWVADNKICALGIQGRHVTTHGLGFNCNTDLSWFDHIVPCGIEGKGVTSLSQECGRDVGVGEVEPLFLKAFAEVFKCEVVEDGECEVVKDSVQV